MSMNPSRRGFTLIELLVAIAIIALLVGILLPVLSRGRESARQVKCLALLKQIYYGTVAYAQDNKNYFPCDGPRAWNGGAIKEGMAGFQGYRVGYKQFVADDPIEAHPGEGPEILGLGASLEVGDYMVGGGDAWICPSRPDYMQANGNTYTFRASRGPIVLQPGSSLELLDILQLPYDEIEWRDRERGNDRLPWAWDNWDLKAYKPGTGFGGAVNAPIPSSLRQTPHPGANFSGVDASNAVFFEGSAGLRGTLSSFN